MTDLAGKIVDGRFRVKERLGEGGMGEVWIAHQESLDREVALKVMRPEHAKDNAYVERFKREARAISKVKHDNVVVVHDTGTCASTGLIFIAMELLRGRSLRQRMRSGALPVGEAVRIAREIVLGLDAAHRVGIIHRDVKPENVMLVDVDDGGDERKSASARVKLLDFGIARSLDNAATGTGALTQTGTFMGTPGYIAPEVALGGTPDARSDLYAVGVVLWELLAGRALFDGNALAVAMRHATEIPPRLATIARNVPVPLDDVTAQLLAKDPAQRPTAKATLSALPSGVAVTWPSAPAPSSSAGRAPTRVPSMRTSIAPDLDERSSTESASVAVAAATSAPPRVPSMRARIMPDLDASAATENMTQLAPVASAAATLAKSGARPRRIVDNKWITVDYDESTRTLSAVRSSEAASVPDVDTIWSWIAQPNVGVEPALLAVFVDLRSAPPTRDKAFESAMTPRLAKLSAYRRSVALVKTATGALHANRVARGNDIDRHLVTSDEHEARTYLATAPYYASDWFVIDLDEDKRLVRIRRTTARLDSSALKHQVTLLQQEPAHIDHARFALLYDSRDAPPRHDVDELPVVAETRHVLQRKYRKVAVLLRTESGRLHAERLGTKTGTFVDVFTDEASALRYLTRDDDDGAR